MKEMHVAFATEEIKEEEFAIIFRFTAFFALNNIV